jgi:hypothetical protein
LVVPLTAVRKNLKRLCGRKKETVMNEKPLPSFERLVTAAATLNKSSDELKKVIEDLEARINGLKIGIPAWVNVVVWEDEEPNGEYERIQVGYAKINSRWCLGIRKLVGHHQNPEPDKVRESWQFNEAPRKVRLLAVEKLGDLFEELTGKLSEAAVGVNKGVSSAKLFAIGFGLDAPKGGK